MFDFGNANEGQRKAIAAADGPVLITAGPRTRKKNKPVERGNYLIKGRHVKPERIFIATIYGKDAHEPVTRVTH